MSVAVKFRIYRGTSDDPEAATLLVDDLPLSPTQYLDETVTNGVQYWYWVASVDSEDVESPWSILATATPDAFLAAPTGLTVDEEELGTVELSWTIHPDETCDGYKVYRDEVEIADIGSRATVTYEDTGVTKGTTYLYEIRATRGTQLSLPSNSVSATPVSVPGAPTLGSITPGDGQLSVALTPPADTGGLSLTNYEYSTNNGSSFTARDPADTDSPIVITGLTNAVEYEVIIRAVNSVGAGANSNMVAATPTAGGASVAYVQTSPLEATGSGTNTVAATLPATPTEGNLLIAIGQTNTVDQSITGFTELMDRSATGGTALRVKVFAKVAGSSESATVTMTTPSNASKRFRVIEVAGITMTDVVLATQSENTSTGTTSLATNSATPAAVPAFLLAILSSGAITSGSATASDMTMIGADIQLNMAYRVVESGAAYTTTFNWTSGARCIANLLAFKAA